VVVERGVRVLRSVVLTELPCLERVEEIVATTVCVFGQAVVVTQARGGPVAERRDRGVRVHVHDGDHGWWSVGVAGPEVARPLVELLPDGEILLVAAHCDRRRDGTWTANAHVFDPTGARLACSWRRSIRWSTHAPRASCTATSLPQHPADGRPATARQTRRFRPREAVRPGRSQRVHPHRHRRRQAQLPAVPTDRQFPARAPGRRRVGAGRLLVPDAHPHLSTRLPVGPDGYSGRSATSNSQSISQTRMGPSDVAASR
jgi:hypothetical protein